MTSNEELTRVLEQIPELREFFPDLNLSSRPRNLDKFMKSKGDMKMKSFQICRTPINSTFKKIVNLVTLGAFKQEQERLGYDDVYHLYLIITFENGDTFSVEKTEVLFVGNFLEREDSKCVATPVPIDITFNQVMKILEQKLGDNLYRYDLVKFNCQNFLLNFVHQSGVTEFDDFIYQDFQGAISDTLRKTSGIFTDIAAIFSRLFTPSIELDDNGKAITEKEKGQPKSATISLLSYNVKMLSDIIFDLKSDFRAERIPQEIGIRYPRTEVVIIQELFDDHAERIFDKGMKKIGYSSTKKVGSNHLLHGKLDDGGVKIYSKLPFSNESQTVFKNSNKEDAIAGKGAKRITVEKNGIPINIIGTHLQSGRIPASNKNKRKQLNQLSNKLVVKEEVTLIAGDMNLNRNNPEQAAILSGVSEQTGIVPFPIGSFSATTDTDFSKRDNAQSKNSLDYFLYHQNDDYDIKGVIQKGSIQVEEGYFKKKDERTDFGDKAKEKGKQILGKFKSKRKRRRSKKRRLRKRQVLVKDLSDHHPILIDITITEKDV